MYKGRKRILNEEQTEQLKQRITVGEPKAQIARDLKISRDTLYKYLDY
ncbi:helix-turn-helix domain-containing protein [Rickettsiales endosymbiont of Stachyamoeba lipophora]|nr:helix-turn-helix domain-containing protein [Rickettsiales endosymbiont of Stachyamoeba lipophora]